MPRPNLPDDRVPKVDVRIRRVEVRHSGGAWKVAYADFVTALMALFIVLWIMGSSAKVKSSIGGYFKDPREFARTAASRSARSAGPAGDSVVALDNMDEIRKQVERALKGLPEFAKLRDQVKFSVTTEGLRIELLETDQGMFFVSGSPEPSPAGKALLRVLATEMSQLPNSLAIEGHTDAKPFRNATPTAGYSNWELATDRANAARRLLHAFGVRPEQVVEVRGFADQHPYNAKNLYDSKNRRVSVVVRFTA